MEAFESKEINTGPHALILIAFGLLLRRIHKDEGFPLSSYTEEDIRELAGKGFELGGLKFLRFITQELCLDPQQPEWMFFDLEAPCWHGKIMDDRFRAKTGPSKMIQLYKEIGFGFIEAFFREFGTPQKTIQDIRTMTSLYSPMLCSNPKRAQEVLSHVRFLFLLLVYV